MVQVRNSPDPAVRRGEGEQIPTLGMTHKVVGSRLGGALLILEGVLLPGAFVHPHTHTREDECSFLLEGSVTFLVGDEVTRVCAGDYVPKPRGVRHAFWNESEAPCRIMEIHTPATFDRYYDGLAHLIDSNPPGTDGFIAAFDAYAAGYGLTLHWDQIPDLAARYGIQQGPR